MQKNPNAHEEALARQQAQSHKVRMKTIAKDHTQWTRQQTRANHNRKCIVCRAVKPRAELLRIAYDMSSSLVIDWKRSTQSRGCYICITSMCMNKLAKAPTILERHLKNKMDLPATAKLKDQIENVLKGMHQEKQPQPITTNIRDGVLR